MSTRFFKFEDLAFANVGERDYWLSSYRTERSEDPVITELERLSKLPVGWDYGEGGPISMEVITEAKKIRSIGKLLNWDMEVIPQASGGVTLTLFQGASEVFCVVSLESNLNINYVVEKGRGVDFQTLEEGDDVDKVQLQKVLLKYKCSSSEHYISRNLASSANGLIATASLTTTVAFRSSATNVRNTPQDQYALT